MKQYDLTVIGGGAGGLVVASGAAQLGARVALVEKEHELGGDCLHYGCVPTKALVRTATVLSLMRRADEFGLRKPERIDIEFGEVMSHMRRIIARVGKHDDPERFERMGVSLYFGNGQFVDPHTFEVSGQRIQSNRFVIATGTRPVDLPIPGLKESGFLTNVSVLQLESQPASLLIIGAGPIGIEFAQIFHRLGTRVVVIEKMGQILPREDKEVSDMLHGILTREGIEIFTCSEVKEVRAEREKRVVMAQCQSGEKRFEVHAILVAVGRVPNLEGLNLEAAGVRYTQKGIVVDSGMRTTARHIWACGDVVGPYLFTHMAEYQAGLVVSNALFPFVRRRADYRVVPWVTYTDPELGRVGVTEAEARQEHGDGVKVYRFPFADLDRAVIDGEERGLVKLVCDSRQRILGAHLLGPHSGDLLHEYVLAMRAGLKITQLSTTIHVYPTLSQAVKRAADQYYREKLFAGWFPRVARWMIRLSSGGAGIRRGSRDDEK